MVAVSRPSTSPRRSRRLRRLVPLLVLAAGAFAGGVIAGARHEPSERRLANRFAQAWEREQYADMYAMLTPRARSETSLRAFARAYRRAGVTATLDRLTAGRAEDPIDETVTVPMTASTRIFGDFEAPVTLPLGEDVGGEPAIDWAPHLVFPGLRRGEKLTRETRDARARDDPRPRRLADGVRRRPAVRSRPGGLGDRRPGRPGAARAGGRAGGARRAGGRSGRHQRPRARVRRRAGRHARAASCSPARACWPASRRSAGAASAPRSIPRSSGRRSRRWPAATAGSRPSGRAPARCSRWPGSPSRRRSRRARCSRS